MVDDTVNHRVFKAPITRRRYQLQLESCALLIALSMGNRRGDFALQRAMRTADGLACLVDFLHDGRVRRTTVNFF
jgi:hypothetical protein